MRRVVQVVRSDGFAGVERYIVDVATELAERGWDVAVIGGDPRRMRRELPRAVSHHPGATVPEVVRALWSMRNVDVVHAHMTAAELPAAVLHRHTGGRLIVTRHFAARRGRSLPGRLAGAFIRSRVDAQIAISRFVADAIGEPSTVIHNGVRASTTPALPPTDSVLVMQRLEREKDTMTAVRAWAASRLPERGWRMVICGRGAEEARLRATARELGVADSIEFAGFVDDSRAQLAGAAIMLATAPAEPFGLAVVEAMAEGTPVVAADGGAHPETLGDDACLFAARNADLCAVQLNRLADSPERRAKEGDRLRERYARLFAVERHVDQLEDFYASDAGRPE